MFAFLAVFKDPLMFWGFAIPLALIAVGFVPLMFLPQNERSREARRRQDE